MALFGLRVMKGIGRPSESILRRCVVVSGVIFGCMKYIGVDVMVRVTQSTAGPWAKLVAEISELRSIGEIDRAFFCH